MRGFAIGKRHIAIAMCAVVVCVTSQYSAYAQPFGKGVFGADVPFGSMTSIAIALTGSTTIPLSPSGSTFTGAATHTVTVTSTDVVGYDLYVNATTTSAMSNGIDTIPASANSSAAALAVNTWGYNTSGSTSNFIGMTTSQVLINSGTGPFKSGVNTGVTYGAYTNITKSAGTYNVDVTYTAVGRT